MLVASFMQTVFHIAKKTVKIDYVHLSHFIKYLGHGKI